MYPTFDTITPSSNNNDPFGNPKPQPLKKATMTKIQDSVIELTTKMGMQAVKPYLSTYEGMLNLKTSPPIQLKIVFYSNYPRQKPAIYVTAPIGHKYINQLNGRVEYDDFYKWTPQSQIIDLISRIQTAFQSGVTEDDFTRYVNNYRKNLENYSARVQSITQKPIPQNPKQPYLLSLDLPEPPAFDFSHIFRQKEYQEQLQNSCENNNQIYKTLLQDYQENESKAQYVSERFGKARILKEIQALEQSEPDASIQGIQNQLADFFAKRKNHHRMEILKQKYLES